MVVIMIGLITVYKVPNYGTKLQAYAMQELLSLYDETEVINFVGATDYRVRPIIGKLKIKWRRKIAGKEKDAMAANSDYPEMKRNRIAAVNKFDGQFFRFSKQIKGTVNLQSYMKGCKAVVCGSDQLWAPINVDADYFTLTVVPKGVRRISYAASFGISDIPKKYVNAYKRFLSQMDSIAVREVTGRDIVKTIADKEATVTIDPTMMLTRQQWADLAEKSSCNYEKYIFCYFLGDNKQHREFAKKLAERTGCKIITIPHCEKFQEADVHFADVNLCDVQPQDFIHLIRNADYVCTDSFHGTVFSVIFGKRVAVFERFANSESGSTNSRIYSLLDMFGMREALMKSSEELDSFLEYSYNKEEVNGIIETEQRKSFEYLDNALGFSRK